MRLFGVIRRQLCSSVAGLEEEAADLSTKAALRAAGGATQVRLWPKDEYGREYRTAKARKLGISTSPHKLNLVARLIRGMPVSEALRQLAGTRKFHREHVGATVAAAVTNGRAFGMRLDRLVVERAFVGKGKYLKKVRPWHGKGRYGIEEKKYAHLTVILRELDEEMWEEKVTSKYEHMQFRKKKSNRNYVLRDVQIGSGLDEAFVRTRERVLGLKSVLEKDGKLPTKQREVLP